MLKLLDAYKQNSSPGSFSPTCLAKPKSSKYCKYLLTCGSDVVDRDNKTTFKNLTVRATNGVVVNADNNELILPNNVEGITKFIVRGDVHISKMRLTSPNWNYDYVQANYGGYNSGEIYTVAKTLYEWRTTSPTWRCC